MYELSIITPEKTAFKKKIVSLVVPGAAGFLEILTDHAPILALIKIGKAKVTDEHKEELFFAVSEGFLEVSHNIATLLVDTAEAAEEIDLARAEAALKRAEERIAAHDEEVNIGRAKNTLQRAQNRIKVYNETHSS